MGRYQDVRLAENITFAEALNKYLERISTTKRPNSESRDRTSAPALITVFGKEISFAAITPKRLAEYRDNHMQTVSPSTTQKEFALVSHLFNIASREWGIQAKNPVPEVRRPKVQNNRTRFLTNKEAQRLLDAAKTSRNKNPYPYLLLLMHTGMRPSKAAGLQWDDVNLSQRLVKLQVTKTDMRYVSLTEEAENVLRSIKPEKVEMDCYVFLPPKDKVSQKVLDIPCNHFKRSFRTARKKAGLDELHLHDLRHTAASHLLMAGVDIRTLAEILGHKTMHMVQRYTHVLHDHKLEAIDKIGSLGRNQK